VIFGDMDAIAEENCGMRGQNRIEPNIRATSTPLTDDKKPLTNS